MCAGPPPHDLVLQYEPGGDQPATGLEQATEQRSTDAEGRIDHHVVRLLRQAEVRRVGFHDDNVAAEAVSQQRRAAPVGFNGNHTCTPRQERLGDHTGPFADVEHDGAAWDRCFYDEGFSPLRFELMAAPWPPPGHGDGLS